MESINETNFNARLNQIGNYTYENRMDTLFIFQLTFIFLLIGILLYYLASVGVIGALLGGFIGVVLIIILVFVYINRITVMNKLRDAKSWSSFRFADDGKKKSPTITYSTAGTDSGTAGNAQTCQADVPVRRVCSNPIP